MKAAQLISAVLCVCLLASYCLYLQFFENLLSSVCTVTSHSVSAAAFRLNMSRQSAITPVNQFGQSLYMPLFVKPLKAEILHVSLV